MDLLVKSAIIVLALVAIFGGVLYLASSGAFGQRITKEQAVSLVLHDLQNSNPTAQVNITNVTPSQYAGSWHMIASVIINATSPCPAYFIYSFDYPKYGFVNRTENVYTLNCEILGQAGNQASIGSASAAITRSYDLHISGIESFVQAYGYSNVIVHATYYKNLTYNYSNYTDVWLVNYTSPKANQTVSVLISQANGSPVS